MVGDLPEDRPLSNCHRRSPHCMMACVCVAKTMQGHGLSTAIHLGFVNKSYV